MIKKCDVILHNKSVMVVDFEGIKIQFPSSKGAHDYVYVERNDEKFTLITKEQYEKSLADISEKKPKKTKSEISKLANDNVKEVKNDEISE